MNFRKAFYRLFIFVSLFSCFTLFFSCYKQERTLAIITVLDNNTNNPIADANVRLFYDTSNGSNVPLIDVQKTGTMALQVLTSQTDIKMVKLVLPF